MKVVSIALGASAIASTIVVATDVNKYNNELLLSSSNPHHHKRRYLAKSAKSTTESSEGSDSKSGKGSKGASTPTIPPSIDVFDDEPAPTIQPSVDELVDYESSAAFTIDDFDEEGLVVPTNSR